MKAHLGAVLLLVAGLGAVAVDATPADATTSYRATRYHSRPIVGERTLIRGSLQPAGRTISLQVYRDNSWVTRVTKRTDRTGHWAFAVTATSTTHTYRTTVPPASVDGTRYARATSNIVRVRGVTPHLVLTTLRAPVGENRNGTAGLTPALARFTPARPGALVTVQRFGGDGAWHPVVTSGRQRANGTFRFNVNAGTVAYPTPLRSYSYPGNGVARVGSGKVTPGFLIKTFDDNFRGAYSHYRTHWKTRSQAETGLRQCSHPSASMITYGHGLAVLHAKRYAAADRKCPYGHFLNAMVGTDVAKQPITQTRGIFAARVKFESGKGQHGAFWLQGPAVTGDEIDTIEYYGDGRRDGGLSNLVHHTNRYGVTRSSGGIQEDTKAILGGRRTPSNSYHVYSVEWNRHGYTFRTDGYPTFRTKSPHIATAAEGMILSRVTSDWELPRWRAGSTAMKVDWVRAWRY